MRTLLFTGPGGAGTTTMATAAAVRAARSGRRTVLLTGQVPVVPGLDAVPGLSVRTTDGRTAMERLWSATSAAAGAVLPHLNLPPASSVVPLPGAADLALFTELCAADADLVVVDAGPLESAATLLGLPATLQWWLDQLMPPGMRALAAVRSAAVLSGNAQHGPLDAALEAVPVVEDLLARNRLADPSATGVCFVAPPRTAAVASVKAAVTTLALYGHGAGDVLVRVLPVADGDEWSQRRAAEQDATLAALAEVASVHTVPEGAAAPADLRELEAVLDGFEPTVAAPAAPVSERHEGAWRLTVPLPFAERADLHLTRWDDDLVLTAGTARRSLRLDALLRRCEVTGGRLAGPGTRAARLEVGFRPDPQLWPADLLDAEGRTS